MNLFGRNRGGDRVARANRLTPAPAGRAARCVAPPVIETLEGRQLFQGVVSAAVPWNAPRLVASPTPTPTPTPTPAPTGPVITVDKSTAVVNDVIGGAASRTVSFNIKNSGTGPLTLSNIALGGADAGLFTLTAKPANGATLAPNATGKVSFTFNPTSGASAGVKSANIAIASNDPGQPTLDVAARGLATVGTGGTNEPSLQRIIDLYGLGVKSGDPNPATTYLLSNSETQSNDNDELDIQKLVKAGSGNVTVEVLGVFAGGDPAAEFGFYPAGNPGARTQVFSVPGGDAQSVVVTPSGSTSFDPGTAAFGLFTHFEIPQFGINNTMYSEDNLNTAENTSALKRKVRFFSIGEENAFLFTLEDFNNHPDGATDANDLVAIIRNVKSTTATSGSALKIQNLDGIPFNDRLIFNRVKNQPPKPRLNTNTGQMDQPPNNVTLDTGTVRVTNTTAEAVTVTGLSVASNHPSAWQVTEGIPNGTVLQPNQSRDIKLKFILGKVPDNGVNETMDVDNPNTRFRAGSVLGSLTIKTSKGDQAVALAGWFQSNNESSEEPSLETMAKLLGYRTTILKAGEKLNTGGRATAVGDEVISKFWKAADASKQVTVTQLAAWHSQGETTSVGWFSPGGGVKTLFSHAGDEGQSWLPSKSTGGDATGSFTSTGSFGFNVAGYEYSDGRNGHHFRFFPVKDRSGNVVPNTYIMGMDYLAINYDYQDNLYLVQNITKS